MSIATVTDIISALLIAQCFASCELWLCTIRLSSSVDADDKFSAFYVVRGLSLGRTDLMAHAVQRDGKTTVSSVAKNIQVRCSPQAS